MPVLKDIVRSCRSLQPTAYRAGIQEFAQAGVFCRRCMLAASGGR
jgi:hypothetical protein